MKLSAGFLLSLTFLSGVLMVSSPIDCEASNSAVSPPTNENLKEVIVVFKTHFDIGYTDLAEAVVSHYRTDMIDKALTVCDESRSLPPEQQFVWTIPGWPMAQILWEGQTPDRSHRVIAALKAGRFVTHALPFTLHTESLELEELVRGLGYSAQICRTAGLPLPRDAKMTDVPSHSWVIPTLLKHAGVDFLHIGCNSASSSPDIPMLFWWEGTDGSRVLTMYSAAGYGSSLVPPQDWHFKTWMALIHTGDNEGPPTPEHVRNLMQQAKQELPGVKVRCGRLSDFADAILAEKPDLPVVHADTPDTWIHGVMSMPIETKIARNLRPKIAVLESLATMTQIWGITTEPVAKLVADAYGNGLRFGEHTWGLNFAGSHKYGEAWQQERQAGRWAKHEASWREKASCIEKVRDAVLPALQTGLKSLAEAVKIDGNKIVVFNPMPWKRSGIVKVEYRQHNLKSLKDADNGAAIPVVSQGNSLSFMAQEVPALGYKTYTFTPASSPEYQIQSLSGKQTLENEFFRIVLDAERGAIISLIDKKSGTEWVDPSSRYALGEYLYERFSKANVDEYVKNYVKTTEEWGYNDLGKAHLPSAVQVPYKAETGNNYEGFLLENEVLVSADLDSSDRGVGLSIQLYRNAPYIDLTWSIRNKKPDSWPEAGWMCLPFKISAPAFKLWRLGGIVDPAKDIVRSANHDVFCLNGGLAIVGDNGSGIGVCPLDTPLVSLERPGLWHYSRDFTPKTATVFVNLFNNQWSTNFQQWIAGSWTSTVRIWQFDRYAGESALITPSLEARFPLEAAYASETHGDLPTSQTGLELSQKGIQMTAFGPDSYNPGLTLRLWEQAGVQQNCEVKLPNNFPASSLQFCDLRGQKIGETQSIKDNRFPVKLDANSPINILLSK